MEALLATGLHVVALRATGNATGTLTLGTADGATATVQLPGAGPASRTGFGWTLRGFLCPAATRTVSPGAPPQPKPAGGNPTSQQRSAQTDALPIPADAASTDAANSCLAVLEFNAARWGYIAFLGPDGRLGLAGVSGGQGFRKGVGEVSALLRPRLDPRVGTAGYIAAALADPDDILARTMEGGSAFGETTFAAAAAYLAPTHDYAIVGTVQSHTKFSVAQDGKVWLANFSIYSPTDQGPNVTGGEEPGVLLFSPQDHTSWWPKTGNFSEYKTSIVGRYTRALTVAAWDVAAARGFSLTVVPNAQRGVATQPYDTAELLVRLEEHTQTGTTASRYFAVRGCVIVGSAVDHAAVNGSSRDELCKTPTQCKPAVRCHDPSHTATAELADGGAQFHANLLAHASEWAALFVDGGLQVGLKYGDGSEGARLVDMARAAIASAMSTYVGLRSNYGDGANYWSVEAADRGSYPLVSFALNHALLLWGISDPVAPRIEYYLQHYVRGANGLTPQRTVGANTTAGAPGSIDLKHWNDACVFGDSYADYGRWLDLWSEAARAREAAQDTAWITRTWPQVKLMAQYAYSLRANATKTRGIAKGLIYGPAEFDECMFQQHWFSVSAWVWRGLVQLQRFLSDTAVLAAERPFAAALLSECAAFKRDLGAARDASLVRNATGHPLFLPPYAVANFTPYPAMPFSNRGTPQQDYGGGAAYANFRYFSEMLSAQFMGAELDVALSEYRESHFGTLSSMTRFRTHLDDMPAVGYAYSSVATNRSLAFNSLLFGHIANYQSRGSFNGPEQLGFELGDDGYRALLGPGEGETDIDTCVPSTTLVAMMLRWMLVFEDRDDDTVWLLKAAPRRLYPGVPGSNRSADGFLSVQQAATRFGSVSFSVDEQVQDPSSELHLVANVSLILHGRGFVATSGGLRVVVRLRDPLGHKILQSAVVSAVVGGQVAVVEIDGVGESVAVVVSRSTVHVEGLAATPRTVAFSLTALLQ